MRIDLKQKHKVFEILNKKTKKKHWDFTFGLFHHFLNVSIVYSDLFVNWFRKCFRNNPYVRLKNGILFAFLCSKTIFNCFFRKQCNFWILSEFQFFCFVFNLSSKQCRMHLSNFYMFRLIITATLMISLEWLFQMDYHFFVFSFKFFWLDISMFLSLSALLLSIFRPFRLLGRQKQ